MAWRPVLFGSRSQTWGQQESVWHIHRTCSPFKALKAASPHAALYRSSKTHFVREQFEQILSKSEMKF